MPLKPLDKAQEHQGAAGDDVGTHGMTASPDLAVLGSFCEPAGRRARQRSCPHICLARKQMSAGEILRAQADRDTALDRWHPDQRRTQPLCDHGHARQHDRSQ